LSTLLFTIYQSLFTAGGDLQDQIDNTLLSATTTMTTAASMTTAMTSATFKLRGVSP
jgi:hypothetical protein